MGWHTHKTPGTHKANPLPISGSPYSLKKGFSEILQNAEDQMNSTKKNHYDYIATQAPLYVTIEAFWRMVFEHNCKLITILATPDKFIPYWPVEKKFIQFENQDNVLKVFRVPVDSQGSHSTEIGKNGTKELAAADSSSIPDESLFELMDLMKFADSNNFLKDNFFEKQEFVERKVILKFFDKLRNEDFERTVTLIHYSQVFFCFFAFLRSFFNMFHHSGQMEVFHQ